MFKHILVPTDGSDLSVDTVKRAIGFAKDCGARLTFYYAQPDYPVSLYGEGALLDTTTPQRFAEMTRAQAGQILSAAEKLAEQSEVKCATLTTVDDAPYRGIIDAAAASSCDLIFMASHGRRGLSGLLLGSETNKVLTHTTIPVLVYR